MLPFILKPIVRPQGLRLWDLKAEDAFICRPQYKDHGTPRYPSLSIAPGVIYIIVSFRTCYAVVKRADRSAGKYSVGAWLRVEQILTEFADK